MRAPGVIAILGAFAMATLSGCSALIAATGTPEEELIREGDKSQELASRLGTPVRSGLLPVPIRTDELRRELSNVSRLPDARGLLVAEALATSDYTFVGRLKRKDDVVGTLSFSVMTFGLAELIAIPAFIAERATAKTYELRVWFDRNDTAVAYVWCRRGTHYGHGFACKW
jgi:hypothetical protein